MEAYENMTIKDICEELDKLDIVYKKKAKKVELIELLVEAKGGEAPAHVPEQQEAPADETPKTASQTKKAVAASVVDSDRYAIIRTGGKQYQVTGGDMLRVEKLAGEPGDTVELTDVLMVVNKDSATIGQPVVEGAKVTATIEDQAKARKVLVFKKKRRKGYQVLKGHRQQYTALRIQSIEA